MPELPGPPEDASDEYREGWLDGAATLAELSSQQQRVIAGAYRDAMDGDESDDGDTDDGLDEAEGECPDCGGPLFDAAGGRTCPTCGPTDD